MIAFLLLAEVAAAAMPMPAFLSGCWEQRRDDGGWTEECWTDPRGGLMIGSGRVGNGDQIRHWEWMRIERGPDGAVTFYGSPKGAPAVGFKATRADSTSVTFVNTLHDYPQRVHYATTATGLEAEVSLADGSKAERWSYRRTAGTLPQVGIKP
jgi:ABC-type sugar transport system substrate-binding protein